MPTLSFPQTPYGPVTLHVERWGPEDSGTLLLLAYDDHDDPVEVFGGYASDWTTDGRSPDWDSAIPSWMQTDALSDTMDRLTASPA